MIILASVVPQHHLHLLALSLSSSSPPPPCNDIDIIIIFCRRRCCCCCYAYLWICAQRRMRDGRCSGHTNNCPNSESAYSVLSTLIYGSLEIWCGRMAKWNGMKNIFYLMAFGFIGDIATCWEWERESSRAPHGRMILQFKYRSYRPGTGIRGYQLSDDELYWM